MFLYQHQDDPNKYHRHCTRDAGCFESVPEGKIPKDKKVYYHATGLIQIIDILKSGAVERKDFQTYQGAFVSTRPETLYGNLETLKALDFFRN